MEFKTILGTIKNATHYQASEFEKYKVTIYITVDSKEFAKLSKAGRSITQCELGDTARAFMFTRYGMGYGTWYKGTPERARNGIKTIEFDFYTDALGAQALGASKEDTKQYSLYKSFDVSYTKPRLKIV